MNNLPAHDLGATPVAVGKTLWLEVMGFVGAGFGVWLLLGMAVPLPDLVKVFLVLTITVCTTLLLMRYLTPRTVRENLSGQFAIFREKHNWVMTWLYVMTFGSFIGYSAAFPKLIQDVFGTLPGGAPNPNAPNPLQYAWLGSAGGIAREARGGLDLGQSGRRSGHALGHGRDDRIGPGCGLLCQGSRGGARPRDLLVAVLLAVHAALHHDRRWGTGPHSGWCPSSSSPRWQGPCWGGSRPWLPMVLS